VRPTVEMGESQVKACSLARGLDGDVALCIHHELRIVAIGPAHEAHPLDGTQGIGHEAVRPPEREGPQDQVIRQGQVAAQLIESPAARLVLNRATILLEAGVAFLARSVFFLQWR
jgi:hypothetical protein